MSRPSIDLTRLCSSMEMVEHQRMFAAGMLDGAVLVAEVAGIQQQRVGRSRSAVFGTDALDDRGHPTQGRQVAVHVVGVQDRDGALGRRPADEQDHQYRRQRRQPEFA